MTTNEDHKPAKPINPQVKKNIQTLIILTIGLIQGVMLYFLSEAAIHKTWPATNMFIFTPTIMIVGLVPLINIQGISNLSIKNLLTWTITATVLLASLSYYDVWRNGTYSMINTSNSPSASFVIAACAGILIGHIMITAGHIDKKFKAHYPTYFDVGWKIVVQFVSTSLFICLFWAILYLGAMLFELIHIDFIIVLIGKSWFEMIVSGIITALAVRLTDVQPNIIRGIRSVILVLLSWLLPLTTLITTGFLLTMLFSGINLLWQTKIAAPMLLVAIAVLIILINTTYQDGSKDKSISRILRYSCKLASVVIMPMSLIAAYSLYMRVYQYGWTSDRITLAAASLIAILYAIGYALAAFKPGAWLKLIETWNFAMTFVILVVLIGLFSPIADPARLAVNNQIYRLKSGIVIPDKFDFDYLRWEGKRFGQAALNELQNTAQGPHATYIKNRVKALLIAKSPDITSKSDYRGPTPATFEEKKSSIKMHPNGHKLPDSFIKQNWTSTTRSVLEIPECMRFHNGGKCDAWMVDLHNNGRKQVIVSDNYSLSGFEIDNAGIWQFIGNWNLPNNECSSRYIENTSREHFIKNSFKIIPPKPQAWPDLQMSEKKFRFQAAEKEESCI